MKKCPACGLSNDTDVVRCRGCGHDFNHRFFDDIITGC